MMNTKKTSEPEGSPEISLESQDKDRHFRQLQQTQIAFFSQPITMMQAAKKVGVDRANVCRYVDVMRKAGAIWIIRKGTCPITRDRRVQFLSTNPKYAEGQPKQLELFPL